MIKRYARFILAFCSACVCFISNASTVQSVIKVDSIPRELNLDTHWRFHAGDDLQWVAPSFNDNSWDTLTTDMKSKNALSLFKGIGWFRIRLKVTPALFRKTFILKMDQAGASEIYLNGKKLYRFGAVSNTNAGNEVPFDPKNNTYFIQLSADTIQVIAVRYSAYTALKKEYSEPGFSLTLSNVDHLATDTSEKEGQILFSTFVFGIFLTLAIFHLLLFFFHRKILSNLYYSLMAFVLAFFWLYPAILAKSGNPFIADDLNNILAYIYAPFFFFIILLIYSIFSVKFNWVTWVLLGITVVADICIAFNVSWFGYVLMFSIISSSFHSFRITIGAVRNKKAGAWIIATGFGIFAATVVAILLYVIIMLLTTHNANVHITDSSPLLFIAIMVWGFSIPTSMSVYLASDFARTNKTLALQLVHVKQLAEQNIQKEKEKQQIIEGQKEMLEKQVKEKTAKIQDQKDQLEEKNKEITDSISYARRIQTAILPPEEMLQEALGDYVVVYKPKDVVSGDFYWCHMNGDMVVFAVADCTGHGVPGAFMSMIGNSILNEVVMDKKVFEADLILNELRNTLISTLQKSSGHTTRDGMDIALCVWDKKNNTLQYAGANNSLYWISENVAKDGSIQESEKIRLHNNNLLEIVADKQPIGYQEGKMDVPFTKHIIQLRKGDTIYVTSDGYIDQFGGEKNKKFTSKRFRDLLDTFVHQPTSEQKRVLEQTIEQWKKYETQTDDICVIGIRV